jgi:hypothetical protein
MLRKEFLALLAILLAACTQSAVRVAPPPTAGVFIAQTANTLAITIDGKPFTTYRFAEDPADPKWQHPYFWPVQLADGTEITADQMREVAKDPKADHPHHRSIWIGFGDINGANHWSSSAEKQRHLRFTMIGPDSFTEELTWDSKGSTVPLVAEVRTVKVVTFADGARGLDITSTLTAPTVDARFACKPLNVQGVEAGLCSLRIARSIADAPDNQKWITAGGGGAAPSVGEARARSVPNLWCDLSGTINGQKCGAAIVAAPQNPGGPAPWHVRSFGFLADIGPLNWTLPKDHSATFRHLIVLHSGDAVDAKIDDKASAWRQTAASGAR